MCVPRAKPLQRQQNDVPLRGLSVLRRRSSPGAEPRSILVGFGLLNQATEFQQRGNSGQQEHVLYFAHNKGVAKLLHQ